MIHTFEVSYELELPDVITCVQRLNERTQAYNRYWLTNFFNIEKSSKSLIFVVPELAGILKIEVKKHRFRNSNTVFRIYFLIEAEVLRTGINTLDLFFCSSVHAKELQAQYAKAIYDLFPEAFTGRPALSLYYSDFADKKSYTDEEKEHSGLYSLPYLALASVKRLDFTYDVQLNTPEEAQLFLYMVGQSYYDSRKKTEKKGKNRNPDSNEKCYDKGFQNGTRDFNTYNKHNKLMDPVYDDRPNIKQMRVHSRNVVRIEMPITKFDRVKVKSMTWLKLSDDAIPLGPLPYLATEQVPYNQLHKEYYNHIGYINYDGIDDYPDLNWFRRDILKTRLNKLVRKKEITRDAEYYMLKISQAISQGRCKNDSNNLKKAIDAFKEDGRIVLHKKRNKNKEQVPETFNCTYDQYKYYRDLAMKKGLMLVTIPDSKKTKQLSTQLRTLRNFAYTDLGGQLTTRMLPYQSISEYDAPELEPVKGLYDDILSFLYGLYDECAAQWNSKMEEALIPVTEENRELFGL